MTPALPTRGDFPGPGPHKGHVTHEINQAHAVPHARQENTVHPRADAEIPRAVQNADIAAEPPCNEATPVGVAIPNLAPAPVRIPEPAQNLLFVDEDAFAQLRGMAVAKEESQRKVSLPDIVPGFKASSLDTGEHPTLFLFSCEAVAPSLAIELVEIILQVIGLLHQLSCEQ
jgi:hypothetical protein